MFDYVEGELTGRSPAEAIIEAGGVGYRFTIPVSTFDALPQQGRFRMLAYLYVREDVHRLYGFATQGERRLFTRLIGVQGIGPSTALAVLNGISVDDFRRAVAEEKLLVISKVKGIGRKTAERIVVELKRDMERDLIERPAAGGIAAGVVGDAVAAMLSLGYKRSKSEEAVGRSVKKLGRDASLEQIIREALRTA